MRVLTWNLFHGRAVPPAGRPLGGEFASRLSAWSWDVALLQEVPPWWPERLAAATGGEQRSALTSRNLGLPLRRVLAARRPDLMKSNGGGCNAILSRTRIAEHRVLPLRVWPERRVAQLVRLHDGTVVVNFHGSARTELAAAELEGLWEQSVDFAGRAPMVLGGDLNLRRPRAPSEGVQHVGERDVDHLFARGFTLTGQPELPDRRSESNGRTVELSDHRPLLVNLRRA